MVLPKVLQGNKKLNRSKCSLLALCSLKFGPNYIVKVGYNTYLLSTLV